VLRVPRLDDADGLSEYFEDAEVMRFIGGATLPRAGVPEIVERWLGQWHVNGIGHFSVERRDDGRVLGRVGFVVWDDRTWRQSTYREAGAYAVPELGWAFARAYWGQGLATEAALAAREWGYRERGIRRLISLIAPENVASQRLAERLGAVPRESVTLASAVEAVVWEHPGDSR
jgi:RimJ/RimL family protein N-acetyltransferase